MSFQPITPMGGLPGWIFLNRTLKNQRRVFSNSPDLKRDITYFRQNIASIKTAEDLVKDRKLLKVALGAFGLDKDIDKQFFIKKVLSEGVQSRGAFANRLVDKSYADLARAFGFGNSSGPETQKAGFANGIINRFQTWQFEIAVGKQDASMRLALGFKREISGIAASANSSDTGWYRILGAPPLRTVIEEALHLPKSFATLKLDRQIKTLKTRVESLYGGSSAAVFSKPENTEKLVRSFLLARQMAGQSSRSSSASTALAILGVGSGQPGNSDAMAAIFSALY